MGNSSESWFFHLTFAVCLTKYGIFELSKCDETGFHHHSQDESKYYQEADYVVYDKGFSTEVMDFRLHV